MPVCWQGPLTSTPSLAGAQDAFLSGLGNLGDLTVEQARQNVSIAYAITYLGGTAGVIALVRQAAQAVKNRLAGRSQGA
jgi:uncharacterized transporter YbjL